jgi:hypothetical protein
MNLDLVSLSNQVRAAIWEAFATWVFMPILCGIVRHGDVILKIHDGKLKDVRIDYSTKQAE